MTLVLISAFRANTASCTNVQRHETHDTTANALQTLSVSLATQDFKPLSPVDICFQSSASSSRAASAVAFSSIAAAHLQKTSRIAFPPVAAVAYLTAPSSKDRSPWSSEVSP